LDPANVIADLKSRDKQGAIREMAARLAASIPRVDDSALVRVISERERLGSTAIGDGVAIPHGKLPGVQQVHVLFARCRSGVDFESVDGAPTHLFFLLVAPENSPGDHLKALARISRLLQNPEFRGRLLAAKDEREIFETIKLEDEKI
jgi:PTS system nitrogen regulatory IIA component